MKRLVAVLLAITLLICVGMTTAFADYSTSASVAYTAPDTFLLIIPEEIGVGGGTEISVADINVATGNRVNIALNGLDSDGSIELAHDNDPSETMKVYFYNSAGDTMLPDNNLVGYFDSATDTATYSLTAYEANNGVLKAGQYHGIVYFTAYSLEAP